MSSTCAERCVDESTWCPWHCSGPAPECTGSYRVCVPVESVVQMSPPGVHGAALVQHQDVPGLALQQNMMIRLLNEKNKRLAQEEKIE